MQGPPGDATYQPPGQPVSQEPMHGKERPYGLVLLLYVVTLGIYGLYWHYKTHDELCKQVGRENKDKTLWFVYIGIYVVVFVLVIIFLGMFVAAILDEAGSGEPTEDDIDRALMAALGGAIALLVVAVIGGLTQLVIFIIYVLRQFGLLADTHQRIGSQLRISGGAFMGLYFGGILVGFIPFIGWIGQLAMQIIAFYLFQENYNEVWRAIRHGRHVPTDAEWAAGGARPAMPPGGAWDAPQMGAGSPAAPPQMGNPGAGTESSPAQASGATASGFAVGQRSPGAPTGRVVRQSFQCPRCQTHIHASGAPGSQVDIRCTNCGEGGRVTLPNA